MPTRFRDILEQMPPERRSRITRRTAELLAELPLDELRRARDLSQEELATSLGVNQSTVSKLERRTDMYISTLRKFVGAMGGQLEITAHFPDGAVVIDQFASIGSTDAGASTGKVSRAATPSTPSPAGTSRKDSSGTASNASTTPRDGRTGTARGPATGSARSRKRKGK